MANGADHSEQPPRPAEFNDLLTVCRELNRLEAKYVVVGGWAVIHHGYLRLTEDIDLLIDDSRPNQKLVRQALEVLPDQAVRQLEETDLDEYAVVRVVDEVIVDLAIRISGFTYQEVRQELVFDRIEDVVIPFASPWLLLKMKERTYREKDLPDVIFLRQLLK